MGERSGLWIVAMFAAAGLAHSVWRHRMARRIAEEWLSQHRYRVRALRLGWFSFMRFTPRFFRNERNAVQFRAEVDDLRLGGTGVVWLRVWTDWIGLSEREPEVSWERMPTPLDTQSRTLDDKLADVQLALLERVSRGESTFSARFRRDTDDGAFDEVVEHVLALSRRGLVTCAAPTLSGHGDSQWAGVTDVTLTESGRRFFAERASERG